MNDLPSGYLWAQTRKGERVPRITTPFGGVIGNGFGINPASTLGARTEAAWRSSEWLSEHTPTPPPGVDAVLWWTFVSFADESIYAHLLSHVDRSEQWQEFEDAGLTRGALAVYTGLARGGLRQAVGALSDKHARSWAAFQDIPVR